MSRSGATAARWQPMAPMEVNPAILEVRDGTREAWANDVYQATVQYTDMAAGRDGVIIISLKRHDRAAVRDWRHFQQIKNDVAGPEREAVELFPAESRLMDTANQYWLWVSPTGKAFPIGFEKGAVSSDEDVEIFNDLGTKGKQRPWQEGLTTGRNEHTPFIPEDERQAAIDTVRRIGTPG